MNKNLKLRDYLSKNNLNIDGRNIPYQLVTATDYLYAKNENITEDERDNFVEENNELYKRINQVMALKQACVLFRNTSYSCGSLSDDLFDLKLELIRELKEKYNYDFDEKLVESYPSEEEYNKKTR
ncbi:MAG: hypothetical protein K0S18_138 [Anaerocolumna sp.]|jgi:hypothetical protein|nr:hypothetical protein [Anaerocolumna sp.]